MIAIYNDHGRISQVMTLYPPGYLEGLSDHGMQGLIVPEFLRPLKATGLINEYYISDGELTQRPANPIPDEINIGVGETVAYPDLPDCKVTFDDQEFDVPAGEFELSAGAPGEYPLYINCFPMQSKLSRVTVV